MKTSFELGNYIRTTEFIDFTIVIDPLSQPLEMKLSLEFHFNFILL